MGWERKGCFVSQGIAKPDVEKGGEIFKFELKNTIQWIKNWHPISNNASKSDSFEPFWVHLWPLFTPLWGDFSRSLLTVYLWRICARSMFRSPSAPHIKGIHSQSPSLKQGSMLGNLIQPKPLKKINCRF